MKALLAVAGALILLAGCASVQTDTEWQRTQQFSRDAVGVEAQWVQTEEDERRVQAAVQLLLKDGMSSDDAVRIALMNNPMLQAAFEDIGIAKADLVQAGLFTNPNLSGLLQFPFHGKGKYVDADGVFLLSDFWQIPLRKKVAAAQRDAALLRVNAEIVAIAAEAKKSYHTYASARSMATDMQQLKDELRRWEEHLTYRERFGFAGELDLLHSAAAVRNGKVRAARFMRDLRAAEIQLLRATGLVGARSFELAIDKEKISMPVALPAEEVLITHAFARRPDLQLSKARVGEADRLLALERALIFKNVGAGASYSHEPKNENRLGPSVSLQLPIFDQNQAQIAKAEYRKRQAEKELTGRMVLVREEIGMTCATLDALQAELLLLRDEVLPLRERAAAFAEKYFNAMQISMLPLLEARQQLLETKLRLLETQKEYYAAFVELERLIGGRFPDGVQPLEPAKEKKEDTQKESVHQHHH
ncbi:MAG TPA: TolC family protein [Dissulfurispiraceae bacterium]|nr:TolC family protein [Dissulfurispiraceae bacterium]